MTVVADDLAGRRARDAGGRLRYQPVAGDVVLMRRAHPCGSDRMAVTLVGLDVRLSCTGCGARVTLSRERLRTLVRDIVGSVGDTGG